MGCDGSQRSICHYGTRLKVRVFGGWELSETDLDRSNFARYGYDNGVPMGGDLSEAPKGEAPTMLVRVLRDVDGANLDRVQIIKGWLDSDGNTHERIYDVRVLEIPTPTWLAFDVKYFDVELPDDAVYQSQERAYTSPIWYTPE